MRIHPLAALACFVPLLACASSQKNESPETLNAIESNAAEELELSSNLAWEDQNDPSRRNGSGKNCRVVDQSDGTRMVYSEDNDWYLYLGSDEAVDCNVRGGGFKASNSSQVITITVLTPMLDGDFTESGVRAEISRRSVSRLMTNYQLSHSFTYSPVEIGEARRAALCADITFEQNNAQRHLVSCITSVKNVNGDILAHSVEYVTAFDNTDPAAAFTAATAISASWYRGTDSDRAGNLVNNW